MIILDIDIDFFLDSIIHNPKTGRPSNSRVKPWNKEEVINFLEKKCNLDKQRKIKGKFFKTHDKLFYCFRDLINKKKLSVPFEIVHVDAHADLGIGTLSDKYIMTELLYKPVNERTKPKRGGWEGLSESNFLAFMIACRWISKLVYVHHREIVRSNVDITQSVKKDFDFYSDFIQLKKYQQKNVRKRIQIFDVVQFWNWSPKCQ